MTHTLNACILKVIQFLTQALITMTLLVLYQSLYFMTFCWSSSQLLQNVYYIHPQQHVLADFALKFNILLFFKVLGKDNVSPYLQGKPKYIWIMKLWFLVSLKTLNNEKSLWVIKVSLFFYLLTNASWKHNVKKPLWDLNILKLETNKHFSEISLALWEVRMTVLGHRVPPPLILTSLLHSQLGAV